MLTLLKSTWDLVASYGVEEFWCLVVFPDEMAD